MKLIGKSNRRGYSLLLVMFLTGVAILILSGVLQWNSASSNLTHRHNEYYIAIAAAEAATEKVIAQISRDFQAGDYAGVESQLASDRALVPTSSEADDWADFEFSNPAGPLNQTYLERIEDWQFAELHWKYRGFYGDAATYRIISNARNTGSGVGVVGAVKQDLQVASIPLFEFGVFYALDLEITIGSQDLTIGGRVHGNTNIYCEPDGQLLTFAGDVTSAHKILHEGHPNDPQNRAPGTVSYLGAKDWNVASLNLPIGTTNTPERLHDIIEIPPEGEPPGSLLGQQRYYNKADLIILVTNSEMRATSGLSNGFLNVDWSVVSPFVSTTNAMWDEREGKTNYLTEIDVGALKLSSTYSNVRDAIGGRDPKIIYIADLRTYSSATEAAAVRVVNAQSLPDAGLTIATMNPLYVRGHFNALTASTRPASLVCDAITILSRFWDDAASSLPVGSGRTPAENTTINAGIIAGIAPTAVGVQSGGLENLLRLLQDWSSRVLTFNGSLVVLYRSELANAPYRTANVYAPPALRRLDFDPNFKIENNLPPGTPYLRTVIRAAWSVAQPNSTL